MSGLDLFGHVSVQDDGNRSSFDFYPTPAFMTHALVAAVPQIKGCTVLSPCAGNNAIGVVLESYGCTVYTNDLDARQPTETHFDATTDDYWNHYASDSQWIIDNLPFDIAFDIVRRSVNRMRHRVIKGENGLGGCAYLLRKTFLEPTEDRGHWLAANPPQRQIGMERYAFRGGSTDSVSCDWFVWKARPSANELAYPPIVIVPRR